jgi:site-specific DNA-adenine methylase
MGSWADDYKITESKRSVARDAPGLRGVKFYSMRYEDFTPHIPPGSIVYCDPPYAGTTGYGGAKTEINEGESLSLNTWNRAAFWRWADKLVEAGQRVFVSEYNGPPAAIYPESHDLKIEKQEWAARFKKLQTDQKSGREDREAAAKMIKDVEARIMKDRERTAARWQVTWEKEVVSSFDSGRGEEGKREVERLFHRAP